MAFYVAAVTILLFVAFSSGVFGQSIPGWMLGDPTMHCYHLNQTEIVPNPVGVTLQFDQGANGVPSDLVAGVGYSVNYKVSLDRGTFFADAENARILGGSFGAFKALAELPSKPDNCAAANASRTSCLVWHANIHSCRALTGSCYPWVAPQNSSNGAVLVTHTPTLVGHTGTFTQNLKLLSGEWIIIAHARIMNFQCAVGVRRVVTEPVVTSSTVDVGLIVGVVIAGLVVISVPVVWKLTENQRRMRKLLNNDKIASDLATSIAEMDFESVQILYTVEKPSRIQQAFIRIVERLKEYKAYMPATLFAEDDDDDEEPEPELPKSPKEPEKRASRVSLASKASRASNASRGTASARKAQVSLVTSASQQHVAVLVSNVRGYHATIAHMDPDAVCSFHEKLFQQVLHAVHENKGVPDTFQGDRLLVSWGAVRPCAQRHFLAAKCGLCLVEVDKKKCDVHISVGVSSGKAICGNMGTSTMRRFTILSPAVTNAAALCCENAHVGTKAVCTNDIYSLAKMHMHCRLVGMRFSTRIWELMSFMTGDSEEWMYQLQQGNEADPYRDFNAAAEEVFIKRNASTLDDEFATRMGASVDDAVMKLLVKAIRTKKLPEHGFFQDPPTKTDGLDEE